MTNNNGITKCANIPASVSLIMAIHEMSNVSMRPLMGTA